MDLCWLLYVGPAAIFSTNSERRIQVDEFCFSDRGAARTLMAASFDNATGMTPAMCTDFCLDPNNFFPSFGFAGVEDKEVSTNVLAGGTC